VLIYEIDPRVVAGTSLGALDVRGEERGGDGEDTRPHYPTNRDGDQGCSRVRALEKRVIADTAAPLPHCAQRAAPCHFHHELVRRRTELRNVLLSRRIDPKQEEDT
jgi:hypothetical protein